MRATQQLGVILWVLNSNVCDGCSNEGNLEESLDEGFAGNLGLLERRCLAVKITSPTRRGIYIFNKRGK